MIAVARVQHLFTGRFGVILGRLADGRYRVQWDGGKISREHGAALLDQ